jgi:hypothetical protein
MNTEVQIDLTPFCDTEAPESRRFDMRTPFVQGEYITATNGKICVFLPTTDAPTEGRKVPQCDSILALRPRIGGSLPWPSPQYLQKVLTCRKCEGTGAAHFRDCSECDGEGVIDCPECHHEYECGDCHGEGKILCGKCPKCDGAKETMQPYAIEFGGRLIAWELDEAIRQLPNVRYTTDDKLDDALWFDFDGGFGCVMPLHRG